MTPITTDIELLDLHPAAGDIRTEVLQGLRARPKTLPCKLFYDARGSELFERICQLDEYYPTRTEIGIMRRHIDGMAEAIGRRCALIEYGSGAGTKSRLLIEHLIDPAAYIPVEISRTALIESVKQLAENYPDLELLPVCADYTQQLELPDASGERRRRVVFFPGSTIGNFDHGGAEAFLRRSASMCGPGGGMLIGVDLKKDPAILQAAYDDRDGVTAEFNYNLLRRINRELGGTFDVSRFTHAPCWNERLGRMESHLRSDVDQTVEVAGERFDFAAGETIHTECSYKYDLDQFAAMAKRAGWRVERVWTDPRQWFSVQYLVAE